MTESFVEIECPVCGRRRTVNLDEYMYHCRVPGHPYTCGNPNCPSHTEMVPVLPLLKVYKDAFARTIASEKLDRELDGVLDGMYEDELYD